MPHDDSLDTAERRELLRSWRLKLEEAREQYRIATEHYEYVLEEQGEGSAPHPDSSLARARQAQSDALADCTRAVWMLIELAERERVPEKHSAATRHSAAG